MTRKLITNQNWHPDQLIKWRKKVYDDLDLTMFCYEQSRKFWSGQYKYVVFQYEPTLNDQQNLKRQRVIDQPHRGYDEDFTRDKRSFLLTINTHTKRHSVCNHYHQNMLVSYGVQMNRLLI